MTPRRRSQLIVDIAPRAVVVDSDVYSARLLPKSELAQTFEPILLGRVGFISFQTAAEMPFGAHLRN